MLLVCLHLNLRKNKHNKIQKNATEIKISYKLVVLSFMLILFIFVLIFKQEFNTEIFGVVSILLIFNQFR